MAPSEKCLKGLKKKSPKKVQNTTELHAKTVRYEEQIKSNYMVWVFNRAVINGKFSFSPNRSDMNTVEILSTIMEYNKKTWPEVENELHGSKNRKTKHHFIGESYDSFSKTAKEEVDRFLDEQDLDRLFSFRIDGKTRVLGIREGEKFFVMWFDPNHEFYPVQK